MVEVLERLDARGLHLGVLTEGWPSIAQKYERIGLGRFFDTFVVSAQEARLKSDPMLFQIASDRMGLPPREILFVDDWPAHVQTAVGTGLQGAVADRNGDAPVVPGLPYCSDLLCVEELTAGNGPEA